jgi:hypothetical protein
MHPTQTHPVQFTVDYPNRPLDRLTTAFRAVVVIPVLAVLVAVTSGAGVATAGGLLVLGPLLMIVFRRKYPRWWFDFNLQLQRFSNRVFAYVALLDDRYPSTTDEHSVHLDYAYPDVERDLNRWMPLVKWFLAIPHYVVLAVLDALAVLAVVISWFAIVLTGRYPRRLFDFVVGVLRWNNRVIGYACTLVTDAYPPFRLS